MLAPAALAVAACVGLGISAFENDLSGPRVRLAPAGQRRRARLRRRSACFPWWRGAVGGRWDLPVAGRRAAAGLPRPGPATGVARVLWLGDPRALPVGGWSVQPGLAYALTPRGPARHRAGVHARRARARPTWWPTPSAWPSPAGRCTSAGCWRPPACATSSWSTALAPSMVGTVPPVGQRAAAGRAQRGPPRAGRPAGRARASSACRSTRTARTCRSPRRAPRRCPWRASVLSRARRTWSGWQPVLGAPVEAGRRPGAVPAGTLYAGYAPAGSFTLTAGRAHGARGSRRSAGRRSTRVDAGPAPPLALAVPLRARWSSCSSWPPGSCWPSRSSAGRRRPDPSPTPRRRRRADAVSPAHHSRERRWRDAVLVVAVVVAGVGIAAGARGTPAPRRRRRPARARWSARPTRSRPPGTAPGSPPRRGVSPGFLVLTNTTTRPVSGDDHGGHRRRVPRRTRPSPSRPTASWPRHPRPVVGLVGGRDRDDLGRRRGGHPGGGRLVGLVPGAVPEHAPRPQWYFPGGTTAGADALYVSLLNPTSTPVVVDLSFVTPAGMVHPINYQGIVLQAGQVVVENVASEVQNVSTVSTVVADPDRAGRRVRGAGRSSGATRRASPSCRASPRRESHWAIPQAAGGGGRLLGDRRLQPGRGARGGDGAPPPAVGPAGPADRHGRARHDLGPADERTDAHPRRRDLLRRRSTPRGARASSWAGRSRCPRRAPAPQAGMALAVDGLSTDVADGRVGRAPAGDAASSPAVQRRRARLPGAAQHLGRRRAATRAFAVDAVGRPRRSPRARWPRAASVVVSGSAARRGRARSRSSCAPRARWRSARTPARPAASAW